MQEISGRSLEQKVAEYVDTHCAIERGLSPRTLKNYKNTLERLLAFLEDRHISLESTRKYMVYLRKEGWELSSISSEIAVIARFVGFLKEQEYIHSNWGKKLKRPKVNKKPYDLVPAKTALEIIRAGTAFGVNDHKLHRQSKREHKWCLIFILFTGIRNREARNIQVEDLRIEKNECLIKSAKGGKWRLVQIPPVPWFVSELEKREKEKSPQDKLFNVNENKLQETMKRGCAALGIKKTIRVHSLRHIFANDLSENGATIQDIANILGHAKIETTWQNYMHLNISHQKRVVKSCHSLVRRYRTTQERIEDLLLSVKAEGEIAKKEINGNVVNLTIKL